MKRTRILATATPSELFLRGSGSDVVVDLPMGYRDVDLVTAQLRDALEQTDYSRGTVEVRLRDPLAQVRTLQDLPGVRPRDLQALVAHQPTRFFRGVPAGAVTTACWLDTGRETARAAMADLAVLECIERAFSANGLTVLRITPEGVGDPERLELLTPYARRRRKAHEIGAVLAWVGLASSGWLLAAGVYTVDLVTDERALSEELARLDEPMRRLDGVADEIEGFAPIAFAARRQTSAADGWAIDRLSRVLSALPSDVHLHRLNMQRDGSLTLEAHGPDPLETLQRLEAAIPGNVRLIGAPSPDTTTGLEHESFSLLLEERTP